MDERRRKQILICVGRAAATGRRFAGSARGSGSRVINALYARGNVGCAFGCAGDAVAELQRSSCEPDGRIERRHPGAEEVDENELAVADYWSGGERSRIFHSGIRDGSGAFLAISLSVSAVSPREINKQKRFVHGAL